MIIIAPVLLIGYGAWAALTSELDQRLLLTPIFVSTAIVAALVEALWRRDRHLPIADVGVVCAIITLTYSALPVLFYVKSGMVWTELSDTRLIDMQTTPDDVAKVSWLVTAYVAAFCFSYGRCRGAGMPGPELKMDVGRHHGLALLVILGFVTFYQIAIEHIFQVQLYPSNETLQANYGVQELPLFIAQITHNLLGIGRIAELGLIAFAICRMSWQMAILLTSWLMYEVYSTLSTLGARTYLAMLVLAIVLSYHRIIKPIGIVPAMATAAVFVTALIAYGFVRDLGGTASINDVWSAATEFQVLLANALHAPWAYERGIISEVPWAVKLSDLIMLIPQQFLPFQKVDPSDWYVDQIGASSSGVGLMFGVVTQAQLGFGLPEIVARGTLLGAVLAFIHRKCVANGSSLSAFIVYLWLCVSVYYSYRATTFYISVYALYRLVPFLCFYWLLSWFFWLTQANRQKPYPRDTGLVA